MLLAVTLWSLLAVASVRAAEPALTTSWHVGAGKAADTTELVLSVTVPPGWHVNANDPDRPYAIPTTLEVLPPAGTTVASIRYPDAAVRSLKFAPGTQLRLYEGTFTIAVRVGGGVPPRLDAKLGYQACNDDTCLPPRTLAVPFEAAAAGGSK